LYLLYLSLLTSARSAVEDGEAGVWLLWLVHAIFLTLAANLILAERFWGAQINRVRKRLPHVSWRKSA
jgi:lipopolysaccharide export system permease protein